MASKIALVAVLACAALAQGERISADRDTSVTVHEREGKLLEIPIMGGLIFVAVKIGWFLISSVWSLVAYKLSALASLSTIGVWAFHNCFTLLLGAAAVVGFCKLTDKCNLGLGLLETKDTTSEETLTRAMRSLENGAIRYRRYVK